MKPNKIPQCELCGEDWFDQSNPNLVEDYESIEQNKRCVACYEEWSNFWPDQL